MFAYCLNNPVNRTDASGTVSLWYYLIVDSDMGFIHRAVQKHIGANYNVSTEFPLGKYGRADILRSGAVWEIKHAGISPVGRTAEAYAQALSYMLVNDEVTCLGEAGAFSGSFYIGCLDSSYLVEYKTPAQGAVLYTVTEVKNYSGEYAFVYVPKKVKQNTTASVASMTLLGTGAACSLAFSAMNRLSCNPQFCVTAS